MKRWVPNTVYIDYYGAEPLLINKNFEVLQHAVDQGAAHNMDLHFSTNGTIWTDEIQNLLSNFREVRFDISIDDIGSRCGYIRYPSTWGQVEKYIEKFLIVREQLTNFKLSICITINNLNVYYLDEIFDYFMSIDLPVNFNMLHLPWHLNIKTLPQAVKEVVAQKLEHYAMSSQISDWHRQYWQDHHPAITTFLMTDVDGRAQYWKDFEHYLRGLDRTRNQNFEQALPEFARLCSPWLASSI